MHRIVRWIMEYHRHLSKGIVGDVVVCIKLNPRSSNFLHFLLAILHWLAHPEAPVVDLIGSPRYQDAPMQSNLLRLGRPGIDQGARLIGFLDMPDILAVFCLVSGNV